MTKSWFKIIIINFSVLLISTQVSISIAADTKSVYYSGPENNDDYRVRLLNLALSYHQDKNYQLKPYGHHLPKGREFDMMAKNQGIDVMAGSATIERATKYQAIRFPILKGLNGWRIPLVNKDTPDMFANIGNFEQLQRLRPGQFHTWTDTKILKSNDIDVEAGADLGGLYGMLDKQRFDYFPRSVLEIEWDYHANKHLNIAIDQHIFIQYPTAYYFYVSKENTELAQDLTLGLEQALIDGSFDNLFIEFYGEVVASVTQEPRHVIKLNNPYLPHPELVKREELWIDLAKANLNSAAIHQ